MVHKRGSTFWQHPTFLFLNKEPDDIVNTTAKSVYRTEQISTNTWTLIRSDILRFIRTDVSTVVHTDVSTFIHTDISTSICTDISTCICTDITTIAQIGTQIISRYTLFFISTSSISTASLKFGLIFLGKSVFQTIFHHSVCVNM